MALTTEDNLELTQVGSGTLMGEFFRAFWIPFLPSADLEVDGRPKRVRLLGEDLIAFRDSNGDVGLVDSVCAHRGAPMFFARNEECGLRCVYHGWKYDKTGRVTETPAEPERSRFKDHVSIKAYQVRERNGFLWAYMGSSEDPPPLPDVEWNLVPGDHVHMSMRVQQTNWLQALEGEIDSAHAPILHGRVDGEGTMGSLLAGSDLRPVFDCVPQEFGMSVAARRRLPDDMMYWRVNQFLLPFYTLVPPQAKHSELTGHAWVPMDDTHTLCVMFSYHPTEPLPEKMLQIFEDGYQGRESGHASLAGMRDDDPTLPFVGYWPKYRIENDYLFEPELEEKFFSGLPGLWVQDSGCQTGSGALQDRSRENLCSSDAGIVMTRRRLLDTARALREAGVRPATAVDPDLSMVRAVSLHLKESESWLDAGKEHMKARLGADFGYVP